MSISTMLDLLQKIPPPFLVALIVIALLFTALILYMLQFIRNAKDAIEKKVLNGQSSASSFKSSKTKRKAKSTKSKAKSSRAK